MLFNRLHNSPIFTIYWHPCNNANALLIRSYQVAAYWNVKAGALPATSLVWLGNYSFIKRKTPFICSKLKREVKISISSVAQHFNLPGPPRFEWNEPIVRSKHERYSLERYSKDIRSWLPAISNKYKIFAFAATNVNAINPIVIPTLLTRNLRRNFPTNFRVSRKIIKMIPFLIASGINPSVVYGK